MKPRRPMPAMVIASLATLVLSISLGVVFLRRNAALHAATARQPGRATLGVHTLVGQEDGRASAVARTRPMATEAGGSSLLAFSAGFASNTAGPVDNFANVWLPVDAPVVYAGYEGRFDVKAFVVLDARGGPRHRVEIVKTGEPAGELTMPVVEIRDAGRMVDRSHRYAPPGAKLMSGSVTTDGPALLVAFWWGDGRGLQHSAMPDDAFTVIESFTQLPPNSAVQCVVAVRAVREAGRYDVTWSTTPEQGASLWLFAFAPTRPIP